MKLLRLPLWAALLLLGFVYAAPTQAQTATLTLSNTATPTSVYPGDVVSSTITVTNTGPDPASGVQITITLPPELTLSGVPTASRGTFVGNMWTVTGGVSNLNNGASATLTFDATVGDSAAPGTITSTATVTAATPNTSVGLAANANLTVNAFIPFPANAHANAGLITTTATDTVAIVGLANGAPGQTTSVFCTSPNRSGILDTPNQWRPCGTGLPYPLYVMDFHEDSTGRIWLMTWGSEGLYYSDDGGRTWNGDRSLLASGIHQGSIVYALTEDAAGTLFVSAVRGRIWRSADSGMTWTLAGTLPRESADTPWGLEAHPTTPGQLFAGTFGRGVLVSNNSGTTWTPMFNTGLPNGGNLHVFDVEFDETVINVGGSPAYLLTIATGDGIYVTTPDLVNFWEDASVGLTRDGIDYREVRALFSAPGDLRFAVVWGGGVFAFRRGAGMAFTGNWAPIEYKGEITFITYDDANSRLLVGTREGGAFFVDYDADDARATDVETESEVPQAYALDAYPNPFNPAATITYALPEAAQTTLSVYDLTGRQVAVLVDEMRTAGQHEVTFDATGLPSGVYLYRMQAGAHSSMKSIVLMK
ncbi:MAG: T9SS type A sorting domain-containing protein [Bacteroidota bacterium]